MPGFSPTPHPSRINRADTPLRQGSRNSRRGPRPTSTTDPQHVDDRGPWRRRRKTRHVDHAQNALEPATHRRRRHQKTSSHTLSESREKRTVDRRSTTANTNTHRDDRRRRERGQTRVTPRVLEPRSRTWTVAVDDADDARTPSTSSRSRVTNHDDDQPRPQHNATQLTTDSTTHADRAPSR